MATQEEFYELYNGEIKLRYLPNSHTYSIDGDKKIGVTTVTGIINKEALMLWPLQEAITFLERQFVGKDKKQAQLWSSEELLGLIKESAQAYRKKSLRGTDAGTAGHAWLEEYFTALKYNHKLPRKLEQIDIKSKFGMNPDKFDDEYIRAQDHNNIVKAIDALLQYISEHEIEVLEVERIIYSKKYDYCGRFDIILRVDGKIYVIDFKTSNPSREFENGVYPENFSQLGGYDIAFTEEFPDFHVDGHAVWNLSKKTGKFAIEKVEGQKERQLNRDFFIFTLGTKRGMQNRTRLLSNKNKDRK